MPGSEQRAPAPRRLGRRRAAPLLAAAVAVGLLLGGCAGQEQSGTPAHQVTTWMNAVGGSGIGNVEVAARNVDLAISRHNSPAAIREVCDLLSNEAQTSIGNLPAPDDELTTQLNNAYMEATAAGDDCYNGASGNAKLMARSAAERNKLASLLATAVQLVESVTGQVPTTETTAPQDSGDPFGGP
jgi:hypothetical protein